MSACKHYQESGLYRCSLRLENACHECGEFEADKVRLQEPDLSKCPGCGGPADNGHDRCFPPSPYYCTKCMERQFDCNYCANNGNSRVCPCTEFERFTLVGNMDVSQIDHFNGSESGPDSGKDTTITPETIEDRRPWGERSCSQCLHYGVKWVCEDCEKSPHKVRFVRK